MECSDMTNAFLELCKRSSWFAGARPRLKPARPGHYVAWRQSSGAGHTRPTMLNGACARMLQARSARDMALGRGITGWRIMCLKQTYELWGSASTQQLRHWSPQPAIAAA